MITALLLATSLCSGSGDWTGSLTVPGGGNLPMVAHFKADRATLDSPSQNATGMPITVSQHDDKLSFVLPAANAHFDGAFSSDCRSLSGLFTQNSRALPLTLNRTDQTPSTSQPVRPQIPKPPFPYQTVDVTIPDRGVVLSGTLTIPASGGPFPAVVMIAGSGPQDRNETVAGHPLFLVIADYLTRHGIAVLRYDKRGVGQSTGDFKSATQGDFLSDAGTALSWLRHVPKVDPARIGLLGHSEGAIIAPALANAEAAVKFAVLLSTPAQTGAEIIAGQTRAAALASGAASGEADKQDALERHILAAIASAPTGVAAKQAAKTLLIEAGMPDDQAEEQSDAVASPWFREFIKGDPLPALHRLAVPTLAIQGSKDLQVLPAQNLPRLRKALVANKRARVVELEGLNHLLQPAGSGLPAEYGEIETTIDQRALSLIAQWISALPN